MTTRVTVVTDAHMELHCHRAGCQDLKPSRYPNLAWMDIDGYTYEVESRDDVIYVEWGESGVASDDYPGEFGDDGYRAYTLERYSDQVRFFPCVKGLK